MKKYSFNEARTMGELGNSSNWAISFDTIPGSKVTSINSLNLIKNQFFPAMDIDYEQANIETVTITVGPNLDIKIPVCNKNTTELTVQFYDTDIKKIRSFMLDWIRHKMKIDSDNPLAPSNFKNIAIKIKIFHYDKEHNLLKDIKDIFYIVPDGSIDFHGDQSYQLDTNQIKFNIVGTE